jgi:hypothetical protein
MSTIPPQQRLQPSTFESIWMVLTELHFITRFFTWLFKLLSKCAEPLLTLAAIYVIISAGVPTFKVPAIYAVALAIMIGAPEVILPGAFIFAADEQQRGNAHAKLLYTVCWCFVGLTMVTLLSLFVVSFAPGAVNLVMWGRCVVGVSYSILLRVITHNTPSANTPMTRRQVDEVLSELQRVTEQMHQIGATAEQSIQGIRGSIDGRWKELETLITEHHRSVETDIGQKAEQYQMTVTEHVGQWSEQIRFSVEQAVLRTQIQVQQQIEPLVETLQAHEQLLSVLPTMIEQLAQIEASTQSHWRIVTEEVTQVKVSLEQQTQALPKLAQRIINSEFSQTEPALVSIPKRGANPKAKASERPSPTPKEETVEKRQFILDCIRTNSDIRNSDIQRKALEHQIHISASYISEVRSALEQNVS